MLFQSVNLRDKLDQRTSTRTRTLDEIAIHDQTKLNREKAT